MCAENNLAGGTWCSLNKCHQLAIVVSKLAVGGALSRPENHPQIKPYKIVPYETKVELLPCHLRP